MRSVCRGRFRIIAHKKGSQVRLYSRPGNDFTHRFRCIIDGEAVACGGKGIASFDLIRNHHPNQAVFLYAFDLIELNGDDLRRDPLEGRKETLTMLLAKAWPASD